MSNELRVIPAASGVVQRLVEWSDAAQGAFAKNSERAFRTDSQIFTTWCNAAGLAALPADSSTVAAFLRTECAAGKAVATLQRRAASIAKLHRAAGLVNPCAAEPVRLALRAIARESGTQQKQAAPLSARDADRISDRVLGAKCTLKNLRDVAMLLVGRDLLARSSELVSLTVEAIEFEVTGAVIALRRHKTSTEAVPYQIGPEAATVLRRWLEGAGISSGAAFRSITKGGNVTSAPLSVRDVGRIVKLLAGNTFSGHSLRVGMACDLVASNVDSASIMQAGGWSTPRMLARYTAKLNAKRGAIARFYKIG